jgi:hypothetical protein
VTVGQTIAKLEALLLRVRARTGEPRAVHGSAVVNPPVATLALEAAEAPVEEEDDQPTLPPPPVVERAAEPAEVINLVTAPPVALELVVEEAPPEPESAPDSEEAPEEHVAEEAPVSSRRPVMPEPEQRLEEIAFGAEEPSPPRHSPPPESGRLLAAPVAQFDTPKDAAVASEARARDLVPEAIVADLAANAEVAEVIGEAQRFAPSSFVELLDATLAL